MRTGEVRFQEADAALRALSVRRHFWGRPISVKADQTSQDGTKVLVMGLPPQCGWQDLKDFMREHGEVAFVQVSDHSAPLSERGALGQPSVATSTVGQVRFEDPLDAEKAVARMNKSYIGGQQVSVQLDESSVHGMRSTILVHGLQPTVRWQELKDHFKVRIGPVAYAGFLPQQGPQGAPLGEATKAVGEVRYEDAAAAQHALNYDDFHGHPVTIKADQTSVDGTKVLVLGLPGTCQWQELKDFMGAAGPVAFVQVRQLSLEGVGPATASLAVGPASLAVGQVRFENPADALEASANDGSWIAGHQVSVQLDPSSHDLSKLIVQGLPATFRWQELKDHFSQFGPVAFAQMQMS